MTSKAINIAVVDDDASVRTGLSRLLRSAGLQAKTFASADEFIAASVEHPCDCLLADATMPGKGGVDLCAELSESRPTLPVILLTANDDAKLRAAAHHAGANGFLTKPVDDQALLDAINWALSRRNG